MYQIGECWKEFYRELDPDRRRELYKTAVQESEDDGANALRKELMELRYTDPRDSMAVLVPAKYGAEKEMELFIRALKDAFLAYSPDAPGLWRAMETGQNSKGFFKVF